MKKFLLTAVLILAVVTSLTAGTLAAYNQTLSITGSDLTSKKFKFSALGSQSFSADITDFTPGKTVWYKVDVTNESEVPVDFKVTAALTGALSQSSGGPVVMGVYKADKENAWEDVNSFSDAGFSFYVKVNWPYVNDADANRLDVRLAGVKAMAQLKVTVNGTHAENKSTKSEGDMANVLAATYGA